MEVSVKNRRYVDDFFTKEEFEYLQANRQLCKELIAKQDIKFWTRQLISFRQEVKGVLGQVYFSQCSDYVFVHGLRNLAAGKKGVGKFLALLCASFTLKPLRSYVPMIEDFLDAQKYSERASLKKTIKELFPPQHIKDCDEVSEGLCSKTAVDILRCEMRQILCVYLRVAGFVTQLLQQLAEKRPLPEWEMPAKWRSEDYLPDDLEDYLREKWKKDLASSVLQVPLKEVAWWNKKKQPRERDYKLDLSKCKMSSMELLSWKPIPYYTLPVLECYFVGPLIEILLKHNKKGHPFKAPACDLAKIRFSCVQLAVPPILALKYHERNIQGLHSMKISAWFASWCTVVPVRNVMNHLLASSKDVNAEEKKQLVATGHTLLNWNCNEALLPEDQISDAIAFLTCKDVLSQFLTNYTIRQQWFVVALFSILKIERETIPLQVWPLPVEHIEPVKEVLTTVKMVKELTLLGLYCHENDMYAEMREFTGKFQAMISICLKAFTEKDYSSLRCLKTECFKEFSFKGQYVNPAYFELDENISCYYSGHPWNFEYYKSPSQKKDPSNKIHDPIGLAECSYNFWKDPPLLENGAQMPLFKGLLGSDAYALVRNNSWNKKGKFVKEVVSAMACMGNIIPATERSRVVNLELASGKFDKPLSAMKGGDYAKMDIIGRIGCHCLLLLNCTNTFKAPDQVLSESAAKTLVGSLVYLAYEMFEMNHLLRLGILLGVVCDFEPVWPLKAEGRDFTHLLTFIRVTKKAELSRLDDKSIEKEEFLKTEGPKEFECGVGVCGSWLREQLSLQLNSIWSSNGNAAAAQWTPLLHYLYPCYIHLYEEQPPIEECLGLFFVLIHQLMSSHKDILKENVCTRDVKMIELQINMTAMHNKILQVMNSTIDQMNGALSHKLAEIFLSTNWCFDNSSNNELSKTLVTKAMNNYSNLWRLHYNMLTTLLLKLTGINIVYDKDYIFKTRAPALSKPFEALFMVHRAVDQMYCALRHEVPVNRTAEFKVAMFEVSTIETTLHPLRSYFYYNLSRFSRCDVDEVMFLYTCSKDFWTFWQALCNARRLISQEMAAMASIKLPNDSFGKCVAAFIRGDFEKTNLLIKPIIPFVLLADDVSEIYKMATDMTVEFPLMENGQQVVNEEDLSSLRDCKFWTSSSSDGGKKKPVKAKKSFKPPKEVIEALREAQKQQSKALQEAQKPQKEIEEHTCNTCKKCVNKKFLTCGECIKTGFPNVNYYCSKSCQTAAWETFHEEEHLISELEKSFNSMN